MVNAEKLDWLNLPEGSTQVPRNPENAIARLSLCWV